MLSENAELAEEKKICYMLQVPEVRAGAKAYHSVRKTGDKSLWKKRLGCGANVGINGCLER